MSYTLIAAIDPVSSSVASPAVAGVASAPASTPSPDAVGAFQAAMSAPTSADGGGILASQLFGDAAKNVEGPGTVAAPMLNLPEEIEYLSGTLRTLESILPAVKDGLPSPVDLLSAQMQVSAIQLEWQFIAKAIGTVVQGVQSLVNSQV